MLRMLIPSKMLSKSIEEMRGEVGRRSSGLQWMRIWGISNELVSFCHQPHTHFNKPVLWRDYIGFSRNMELLHTKPSFQPSHHLLKLSVPNLR